MLRIALVALLVVACSSESQPPSSPDAPSAPDAWRWAGFEQWGDACFRAGSTAPVPCKGEQGDDGWCVRYLADVCEPRCEPDDTCSVGCPMRGEFNECFCAPCF